MRWEEPSLPRREVGGLETRKGSETVAKPYRVPVFEYFIKKRYLCITC